ncbi:MAG: site-specific integrase [Planctomycetota bacterium]
MRLDRYVQRRDRGYFYFRQRMPSGLRDITGKQEIVVSLRTRCPREAAERAVFIYATVQSWLEEVDVSDTITPKHAMAIAEHWRRRMLDADLDRRIEGQPLPHPGLPPFRRDRTQDESARVMDQARRGDFEHAAGWVNEELTRQGVAIPSDSSGWRRAAYYLVRAQLQVMDDLQRRDDNSLGELPVHFGDAEAEQGSAGHTLSQALAGWKSERTRPPNTLLEYSKQVQRFIELHGDLPVTAINKQQVREFKEAIQRLPKARRGDDAKRTLPELIAKYNDSDVPRVVPTSVKKAVGVIHTVLGWCVREGILDDNPAANVRVPDARRGRSSRQPFSRDDLRAIFERSRVYRSDLRPYRGSGEAAYWIPVLALYTGARLGELGQLRVADFETSGKSIVVSIRDDGQRSVKTKSSLRRIPVHWRLIDLGLIERVEWLRSIGRHDLFPLLPTSGKRTARFSKWINMYLRDACGIDDPNKVFHSFRHTFKDACREMELPEGVHNALLGHADGSVGGLYGSGYSNRVLNEWLQKIEYPGLKVPPPEVITRL